MAALHSMVSWSDLFDTAYWSAAGFIPASGKDKYKVTHLFREDTGVSVCRYGPSSMYGLEKGTVGEIGLCCRCVEKAKKEISEDIFCEG